MAATDGALGYTLERQDDGQRLYFSLARGKDAPATAGWWTPDPKQALSFSRNIDAQRFMDTYQPHMATLCTVKPMPMGVL